MTSTTFMFPGQGSQFVGMGRDLFQRFPSQTSAADRVLGYSIERLCVEDAGGRLTQTQFTQPALYVVNALTYLQVLAEVGERPAYVIGHSLGEYNALLAAGVFDFESGLRLVQKRGQLMSGAVNGGMAAVIGLTPARIREVLDGAGLDQVDLANLNEPMQTVISGPAADVVNAKAILDRSGAKLCIPLKVSGAFHSRLMRPAQVEFRSFLDGFEFNEPAIPLISNAEARPYTKARVRELLAAQLISPVRWCESIQWLIRQGQEQFREVGPGRVLAGLLQKIRS